MTRKDLSKALEAHVGGYFINQTQLSKFLRVSRSAAADILHGIEYLQSGREKKYFVGDVAERIKAEALQ